MLNLVYTERSHLIMGVGALFKAGSFGIMMVIHGDDFWLLQLIVIRIIIIFLYFGESSKGTVAASWERGRYKLILCHINTQTLRGVSVHQ